MEVLAVQPTTGGKQTFVVRCLSILSGLAGSRSVGTCDTGAGDPAGTERIRRVLSSPAARFGNRRESSSGVSLRSKWRNQRDYTDSPTRSATCTRFDDRVVQRPFCDRTSGGR